MAACARLLTLTLTTICLVSATLGCDPEAGAPRPEPEPPEESSRPEAEPIPELSSLEEPVAGRATLLEPRWARGRFTVDSRSSSARYGYHGRVWRIVLGDDVAAQMVVVFRGETPPPVGEHAAQPAGGVIADGFRVSVVHDGEDLRTESATVTIQAATEGGAIRGTLDAQARSRQLQAVATARARFHAVNDRMMNAEVEHQEAIRQDLRRRGR